MNTTVIKTIVIVGAGYAPLLSALYIKNKLNKFAPKITVITTGRNSDTPIIHSLSSMKEFHSEMRLSEIEFIKCTQADFHLGYLYQGWQNENQNAMFCDAEYGFMLNGFRFHQLFCKYKKAHPNEQLEDYCLTAKMVRDNKFTPPSNDPKSLFSSINYGYRVRSSYYHDYLKSKLKAIDIEVLTSRKITVTKRSDGYIQTVGTDNNITLSADLYIDCSTDRLLKSELTNKLEHSQLGELNITHSESPASNTQTADPYSVMASSSSSLRVSHTHKQTQHTTTLSKSNQHKKAESTTIFADAIPWDKNCIALGAAFTNRPAILIDPSHLIQSALARLLSLWPRDISQTFETKIYNENTLQEYANITDSDSLHLALAFNDDSLLTNSAQYKKELFQHQGKLALNERETLQDHHWVALFYSLGIHPKHYDAIINGVDNQWLEAEMSKIKSVIGKAVKAVPSYTSFIEKNCR